MGEYRLKLTPKQILRADVWDASDRRCHYCRKDLHPLRDFVVDHVYPKCAGGGDVLDNLVAACRECNHHKGVTQDVVTCKRVREERKRDGSAGNGAGERAPRVRRNA
jgi:5-methylcytosine-specific restriction endonuclease McrA